MTIRDAPHRAARLAELVRLLVKHGRSDAVRRAAIDPVLADGSVDAEAERRDAEELAADLERLGPTFIKFGQLLSTRADLLPPVYLDALSRLQDELAPFPFDQVRDIVEDELGARLSRAFGSFDETPLAAASLGQVHAATLRDGHPVVVKVQRPGVRRQVAEDLELLESLARKVEDHSAQARLFAVTDLLEQFRRSLLDELDYRKEASNLLRLREIVADRPSIVVPAPYDDYTTRRVLTMDRIAGRKVTELSGLARLDIAGAPLARALFQAYLDQILVHGFFHADPHPGNVLLTPDGRLGLIDLGMVARVTPQLREHLVQLLLAVAERRGEEAARLLAQLAEPTEDCDQRRFTADVADLVERRAGATVQELDAGRLVLDLTRAAAAAGLRPPPELSMVGKALLNLDLVARLLDPEVEPVSILRRQLVDIAREGVTPSLSGIVNAAMETRAFAEQLPGRVNRAMDALADGRFELRVHAFDETAFLTGLHRVANRVATGVVIAALIVGAALLSSVKTSMTIAGYPAVAFVLFLAAAVGGLWLVLSIVVADRRIRRRR